jgi:hypothetical protein
MISKHDMEALAPDTRTLDTERKDWREHLDKIIRMGDTGTRVVYWEGPTDVDPRGKRKEVFDVMRGYSDAGKVHLYQRCVDAGVYAYEVEVR